MHLSESRSLSVAVVSIARTRRRRFLWAAWYEGAPQHHPFRKPDAHGGGARSHEEALRDAERETGRALSEIGSEWARAWSRVMQGERPWEGRPPGQAHASGGGRGGSAGRDTTHRAPPRASIWEVLGVSPNATLEEIKREFRKRAKETHPDQGGDADAFRALQRAYERALVRRAKRPR